MFTNLLAMVFGWRGVLFGAALAFAAGAYSGHEVTKWYYQVELTKIANKSLTDRNAALEDNLRLIREVLNVDTQSAEIDTATLATLRSKIDETIRNAEGTPALSAPTVDRLRRWWD